MLSQHVFAAGLRDMLGEYFLGCHLCMFPQHTTENYRYPADYETIRPWHFIHPSLGFLSFFRLVDQLWDWYELDQDWNRVIRQKFSSSQQWFLLHYKPENRRDNWLFFSEYWIRTFIQPWRQQEPFPFLSVTGWFGCRLLFFMLKITSLFNCSHKHRLSHIILFYVSPGLSF